jgi:tagatose 1,6-diphosphate aldolase
MSKKTLSIGKHRALQRASTDDGLFTILAIDHQDALRRAIQPKSPENLSAEDLIIFKHDIVSALISEVSGVLLDPIYGTFQAISAGILKHSALLVELEKADYQLKPLPLDVEIDPDWNVSKIKCMGADGVKLFFYYNPENDEHTKHQDGILKRVAEDCIRQDIPFYAEPIVYEPYTSKREAVIESARRTAKNGADILKLEFPIDIQQEQDEKIWFEACKELTSSVDVPWVLLSAGVDFETFTRQLKIACQAGASGFIVGGALWGDAAKISSRVERNHWLQTIGKKRLNLLTSIANLYGRTWLSSYATPEIDIDYFRHYREARHD